MKDILLDLSGDIKWEVSFKPRLKLMPGERNTGTLSLVKAQQILQLGHTSPVTCGSRM
jgi:hypothetical protein